MNRDKLRQQVKLKVLSELNNEEEITENIMQLVDNYVKQLLGMADVVVSAEFEKLLEKAIEGGNEVGYNADGGYNYYCEGSALREVLKVIKKHLL